MYDFINRVAIGLEMSVPVAYILAQVVSTT